MSGGGESLKAKEVELEDKLHAIELEFKTHVERVDARRLRVGESEQELIETTQLLLQTRQREDCDRLQVLRLLEDLEKGLLRQEERIKGIMGIQKKNHEGMVEKNEIY